MTGSATPGSAPPGYAPPRRTPTNSSYYDFNGTPCDDRNPNSQTRMYAREAREQTKDVQGEILRGNTGSSRYPGPFHNNPGKDNTTLPLQAKRDILHHPLVPGQTAAWTTGRPGGVRSFFTCLSNFFDVAYHDPTKGVSKRGHHDFTMATYVPAAPPPPASGGADQQRENRTV
ncbi:hypothetical protein QBC46DRAFT_268522 [Diplogelasinospora grovesii]|uniref:Uncharacterized protein n=1 Tax=Diplogelasinospora grovesii TaxID=303347 RepID=A0AAN6S1E7_9PEZI|nr:hypothetical protein QBC46DRAFT_268522 [Diplogelasinospora grovesii]